MMRPLFFSCILVFLSTFVVASDVQTNEPDGKQKRPKVGLVLSGGGAKGFAYIGLFRVLEEVGLPIDYVGGTS
ncbi:MAG: patatin-like phospholipase family protein, partial [Bacteroidales bacterium]|nr:patatin-like phospholipase family protein [Bacteroidales bacterium]